MEQIEVAGPSRLTIVLDPPYDRLEALLHWIPMLPRHVWENTMIQVPEEVDESALVGTGPFELEEFVPGQRITLGAHRGYWAQPASVDEVVFTTYADAEALADALEGGSVDLITVVPMERIKDLRTDRNIQVVSGLQTTLGQLICNVSGEPNSTGHPALLDPLVRLAVAHAVDRQQLVDLALGGQALPGLSLVPPGLHSWFQADVEDAAFDLGQAKRILDEAGYADVDGDGVREMPDGSNPLMLRLYVSADSATGGRELDLVSNWLRQIGIGTTPERLPPEVLESACCPASDYDLMLDRLEGGPDPGFYLSALTSAKVASGLNASGYHNPAYDALYEQQAGEPDPVERRQTILQMQELHLSEHPTVVLYYPLAVQAFRKDRFENWLFVPHGLLALTDPQSLVQVLPVQ
jgi:peptide/nickel transport system substrate-binding protein